MNTPEILFSSLFFSFIILNAAVLHKLSSRTDKADNPPNNVVDPETSDACKNMSQKLIDIENILKSRNRETWHNGRIDLINVIKENDPGESECAKIIMGKIYDPQFHDEYNFPSDEKENSFKISYIMANSCYYQAGVKGSFYREKLKKTAENNKETDSAAREYIEKLSSPLTANDPRGCGKK